MFLAQTLLLWNRLFHPHHPNFETPIYGRDKTSMWLIAPGLYMRMVLPLYSSAFSIRYKEYSIVLEKYLLFSSPNSNNSNSSSFLFWVSTSEGRTTAKDKTIKSVGCTPPSQKLPAEILWETPSLVFQEVIYRARWQLIGQIKLRKQQTNIKYSLLGENSVYCDVDACEKRHVRHMRLIEVIKIFWEGAHVHTYIHTGGSCRNSRNS